MKGGEVETRDLCYLTIAQAGRLFRRREVSPVEVVRALLERIQSLNGRLNAYITVLAEGALREAQEAERALLGGEDRGPLHGIPLALKDLFATRGVRTTAASRILADWVPEEDAAAVARLREAGTVLLGKLNLHEMAYGITNNNPHYGPCRNPWDPERVSGGSSGGSACALAAGLCLGSLGSDTGGSIRVPAAFCGVVGLKPTYGRVSRWGALPLAWSLDHIGPMARTVEDTALLLQALAGHDPRDPSSLRDRVPSYRRGLRRGVKGLRIGFLGGDVFQPLDGDIASAVHRALRDLEGLGATVEEVEVPPLGLSVVATVVIQVAEAASYHQKWMDTRRDDYGSDVWNRLALGRLLPASLYVTAQRARQRIREALLGAFQRFHILALPTTPLPAPPVWRDRVQVGGREVDVRSALIRFTMPFNLTGVPALSLPCGFTRNGLPIGLQLVGPPLGEPLLLRAAYAYEQAARWTERRPPL